MKITYLSQSGFFVELDNIALLFDYYKGDIPKLPLSKYLYVFVSHRHFDHYSKNILSLIDTHPNTNYILSYDIEPIISLDFFKKHSDNIFFVQVDEELEFAALRQTSSPQVLNQYKPLKIKTLDSTDEGLAFLVWAENKNFFHAGDLNWWTWIGETEDEYENMTRNFFREVEKLKNVAIDIAFIPLDPRQKERFYWGFDYFMKNCNIATAFPMHFWKDFSVIPSLKKLKEANEYKDKVVDIKEDNQEFVFPVFKGE